MSIFFFHICDGSGTVSKDEVGVELPDASAALARALEVGQQFIEKEASASGLQPEDFSRLTIEVKDDSGGVIGIVPLSELSVPGEM